VSEVGLLLERIIGRSRKADLGEFDCRPTAFADQGDVGVDHGQFIGAVETHDVLIVQIMGEDTGDWVQVGKIAVVLDTVMHGFPQCLATRPVNRPETTQLAELLRELWDFR